MIYERKLGREKINGKSVWAYADTETGEIHLDERLRGKIHLRYAIHEKLHILFPDMSEKDVRHNAKELQMYLSALGYKRLKY